MIRVWKDIAPRIDKTAFVEDSAMVIGDVSIGAESSVWFNVTIRGDVNHIRIGNRVNVQDGSVLHVTKTPPHPLLIGDNVTIGHSATVHGCTIDGPALIGMGAIVMDGAILKKNVIVAAGALVPEGMIVEEGTLALGAPARAVRKLTDDETGWLIRSANNYVEYRLDYMTYR